MPDVLRALPYSATPTTVSVAGQVVPVLANQIIVWVAIAPVGAIEPPADVRRFPAILDTGHTHNFVVTPAHLRDWAGIEWRELPLELKVERSYQGVPVPHRRANLWLFPNQYGWRDWGDPARRPALIELSGGVAVFGGGELVGVDATAGLVGPRLSLLGCGALSAARADLRIDAGPRRVWLSTG